MKKKTYNILILIGCIALCVLFLSLIFKKDYGYDFVTEVKDEKLIGVSDGLKSPINKTINGIDFIEVQSPIGIFGGEFKDSIISDPKTFNPYNSSDATSSQVSDIMYDGLVYTNVFNGEIMPLLAKSFEILPDKKTYIVHLRKGIKWSDGKEITAEDVYFTYDTIIFGGFGSGSSRDVMTIDGEVPKVEIIDKYTVKFTTPKVFAPFLRNLSFPIVPKHVYKKATDKGKEFFLTFQGVDIKPDMLVTSGAFKLKEYVPAQRLVYERNNNYYLINSKQQKLPYLDKYILLVVGDLNNQTLKFESGEIDITLIDGSLLNRYKEFKEQGKYNIYNLGASTDTTFVVFNLNNRKNKNGKYYVDPIKQAWFQNKEFRRALSLAVDREDLILNVFSGLAYPLYSATPVGSIYLNEKVAKGYEKNVELAKEILIKNGFYYKEDILYDKNNNRVEFELLTNTGNTRREAAGVSIKQDFEKLGIKVNFKSLEFNSLVNRLMTQLDFDCVLIAFTSNILEPNSGYNVWTSNGSLHTFNKRTPNDLKSSDKLLDFEKELDELFKKGALELDFKKRKAIYDKYQEIIARENPMIYLYAQLKIYALRDKFKNVYPSKLGGIFHNLSEVYIQN